MTAIRMMTIIEDEENDDDSEDNSDDFSLFSFPILYWEKTKSKTKQETTKKRKKAGHCSGEMPAAPMESSNPA